MCLWGKTTGVFRSQRAIICPYSMQEQVTLVQHSGVFYDFTDIYHRIYEHNEPVRAIVDWRWVIRAEILEYPLFSG